MTKEREIYLDYEQGIEILSQEYWNFIRNLIKCSTKIKITTDCIELSNVIIANIRKIRKILEIISLEEFVNLFNNFFTTTTNESKRSQQFVTFGNRVDFLVENTALLKLFKECDDKFMLMNKIILRPDYNLVFNHLNENIHSLRHFMLGIYSAGGQEYENPVDCRSGNYQTLNKLLDCLFKESINIRKFKDFLSHHISQYYRNLDRLHEDEPASKKSKVFDPTTRTTSYKDKTRQKVPTDGYPKQQEDLDITPWRRLVEDGYLNIEELPPELRKKLIEELKTKEPPNTTRTTSTSQLSYQCNTEKTQ